MKVLENKYITDVTGFKAAGIVCGLKKSGKKDLCVIYSEKPAVAAAAFTTNKIKAAPLLIDMENIKSKNIQAIVVNSGNANACTGSQGYDDANTMVKTTGDCLGISDKEVLVCSTGIIGELLPMDTVISGIKSACDNLSEDGGYSAAEAIITTDTSTKTMTVEINLDGKPVKISGMAKGSGMIHPNMATMLSFITTDVSINKELLDKALKDSVNKTYNMISVDGDTSTNDMVVVLANGAASNNIIDSENDSYIIFKEALDYVNTELAKMIAKDGEGATKLIEVNLSNAKTQKDADLCAKSVISSSLVKAAFFGCDVNWGRIMCAIGYSGGDLNPNNISISLESSKGIVQIAKDGAGIDFDRDKATSIIEEEYVKVIVDLDDGEYGSTAWGCDLSYDYVKINGCYHT